MEQGQRPEVPATFAVVVGQAGLDHVSQRGEVGASVCVFDPLWAPSRPGGVCEGEGGVFVGALGIKPGPVEVASLDVEMLALRYGGLIGARRVMGIGID